MRDRDTHESRQGRQAGSDGKKSQSIDGDGLIGLTTTSALLWVPGNSGRDHQSLHPSEEEETTSRSKCSERTKKCIRGVVLTLLIAFSWVGTLHLLKLTFHWNQRMQLQLQQVFQLLLVHL